MNYDQSSAYDKAQSVYRPESNLGLGLGLLGLGLGLDFWVMDCVSHRL